MPINPVQVSVSGVSPKQELSLVPILTKSVPLATTILIEYSYEKPEKPLEQVNISSMNINADIDTKISKYLASG